METPAIRAIIALVRETLAFIDAALTLAALVLVLLANRAIRRRDIRRHKQLMTAAFVVCAVFLVPFVSRIVRFGLAPFRGQGAWRGLYWLIFVSHDALAVVSIPLIIASLVLGLAGRYAAHKELAPTALWVWVFVTASGLALYVLLYRAF